MNDQPPCPFPFLDYNPFVDTIKISVLTSMPDDLLLNRLSLVFQPCPDDILIAFILRGFQVVVRKQSRIGDDNRFVNVKLLLCFLQEWNKRMPLTGVAFKNIVTDGIAAQSHQ